MWWDDLELLRLIDKLEQGEVGSLFTGLALLQTAIRGKASDYSKEMPAFTRELLLAADAGYVTWKEVQWPGQGMPDPGHNPNDWLQRVQEIRLTLAGRDRARGRFVIQALPDPDEDDGRPIAKTLLTEIAGAIASEYTDSQLLTFLVDSGIPANVVSQITGNQGGLLALLLYLHDGGAATRRQLRTFLGNWLSDRLLTGPAPEQKEKFLKQFDRQGWQVRDCRLAIGTGVDPPEGAAATGPEQAQICLTGHPINFRVKGQPQLSKDFCPRCGKRTIKNCLACGKEISGDELVVDAYCKFCGGAFPWTQIQAQS
jgi:Uncharacterized protein conserved in bacteria (DUF2321)